MYGPNADFTVDYAGENGGLGGSVTLIWTNKQNQEQKMTLGHMTGISEKIIEAAQSGKKLEAGTFLGEINGTIGISNGPHAHWHNKIKDNNHKTKGDTNFIRRQLLNE